MPCEDPQRLRNDATDAARHFVAGLLRWPQALDENPDVAAVRAEDIPDAWLRDVFDATRELYDRQRSGSIDLAAAFTRLAALGRWDRNKIAGDLADLADLDPTGAYVPHFARLVRRAALLRQIDQAGAELQRLARSAPLADFDPADLIGQAGAALDGIADEPTTSEPVLASDAFAEALAEMKRERASNFRPLRTGLAGLDSLVPGLKPQQLAIVAARTSVGKSAFGNALALYAAHMCGVPTYLVTLEMTRLEVVKRMAFTLTGLDSQRFEQKQETPAEMEEFQRAEEYLKGRPLLIHDAARLRIRHIAATARRMKRRRGLGLVIVDYLQIAEPDHRNKDRRVEVEDISRALKALARELSVPVVAMAQVNRKAEEHADGRPRLSDLREAGAIEQDADLVMLLWRLSQQEQQSAERGTILVGIDVAKQRSGPRGEAVVAYRGYCYRFEDYHPLPPGM